MNEVCRSFLLVAALIPSLACAQEYTVTTLGNFYAHDINNQGQVIGIHAVNGHERGVLWQNGVLTDLGLLTGRAETIPHAINNLGQIVGEAYDRVYFNNTLDKANQRGFLWQNGSMTALDLLPGFERSIASDINDQGQVTGNLYEISAGTYTRSIVFIWQNGVISSLSNLPSDYMSSNAYPPVINNNGVIASQYFSSGNKVFLWNNGAVTSRDYVFSPVAINDQNQLCGNKSYDTFGGHDTSWIYQNGRSRQLELPHHSYAYGMNNNGQIVGYQYSDFNKPFVWKEGVVTYLTDAASFPTGARPSVAVSINDAGEIIVVNTTTRSFLLSPTRVGITSNIKLGGWRGNINTLPISVKVDNGQAEVMRVTGSADTGRFTLLLTRESAHSLWIKPKGFLARKQSFQAQSSELSINFYGASSNGLAAGDVNDDNRIDNFDLTAVIFDFGASPSGNNGFTDVTGDGMVDDFDLAEVIFNFGKVGDQ